MFLIDKGLWWLAGACLAMSLAVPNGYNFGALLLFLLSVLVFVVPRQKLMQEDRLLVITFAIYFLLMAMFVFLDGWHTRELDRPSRFILVIPVLYVLLYRNGPRFVLWVGANLAAYGAFSVAIYERFILNAERAGWGEHPIMFGNISMMLGLLCAAGGFCFLAKKQYLLVGLSLIGFSAGVLASFLSGSRGGWIAVPLIILFMLLNSRDLLGKKALVSICVVGSLSVLSIVSLPSLNVGNRLMEAAQDIEEYVDGDHDSSIGKRFEMWEAAILMFESSPLTGVGAYGSKDFKQNLADNGVILQKTVKFDHAHNEYLNALSLTGIIGFLALMAAYLVPLRLFLRKMREYKNNWNVKAYAMAGALVPMSYMDFALSQSMFSHNIGVMMYVFPIVFFWAAVRWAEKECAEGLAPETLKANKSD